MKKKGIITVLALIGAFAFGGVAGAGVLSYVQDLRNWEGGYLRPEVIDKEFATRAQEVDSLLYRDTKHYMGIVRDEITKESLDYMDKALQEYKDQKQAENSQAIDQEAEAIKTRTQEYIDTLIEEKFGTGDTE